MELFRTGERARSVFLKPSRKFNLLFVGDGVRDESLSINPQCPPLWVLLICPFFKFLSLFDPITVRVGVDGVVVARLGEDSGVVDRL